MWNELINNGGGNNYNQDKDKHGADAAPRPHHTINQLDETIVAQSAQYSQ